MMYDGEFLSSPPNPITESVNVPDNAACVDTPTEPLTDSVLAEIERLRAENKRLKEATDRVDAEKHKAIVCATKIIGTARSKLFVASQRIAELEKERDAAWEKQAKYRTQREEAREERDAALDTVKVKHIFICDVLAAVFPGESIDTIHEWDVLAMIRQLRDNADAAIAERDAAKQHQQESDARISNQREEIKKLTSDRDLAVGRTHRLEAMRRKIQDERDGLRRAIEAAPHDPLCSSQFGVGTCIRPAEFECAWEISACTTHRPGNLSCDCWKSVALAAAPAPVIKDDLTTDVPPISKADQQRNRDSWEGLAGGSKRMVKL